MPSILKALLDSEVSEYEMASFHFALINLSRDALKDCILALRPLASRTDLPVCTRMWANLWLGEAYMRDGDYVNAGNRFARIIALNQGDHDSLNLLYFTEAHRTYAQHYESERKYAWAACHWRRVAALARHLNNQVLLKEALEHLKNCESRKKQKKSGPK
jgi:hypothetical protein